MVKTVKPLVKKNTLKFTREVRSEWLSNVLIKSALDQDWWCFSQRSVEHICVCRRGKQTTDGHASRCRTVCQSTTLVHTKTSPQLVDINLNSLPVRWSINYIWTAAIFSGRCWVPGGEWNKRRESDTLLKFHPTSWSIRELQIMNIEKEKQNDEP